MYLFQEMEVSHSAVTYCTGDSEACSAEQVGDLHAVPCEEQAAGDIGSLACASASNEVRCSPVASGKLATSSTSGKKSTLTGNEPPAESKSQEAPVPAKTTIYSRAYTTTAPGGGSSQIAAQSRVASTVSGSIAVADSVSNAAASAASGTLTCLANCHYQVCYC